MSNSSVTFQTLAEREVRLREESKLKRAEKMPPRRERCVQKPASREVVLQRLIVKSKQVESGCIEWQGSIDACGYGKCSTFGGETLAHRMMWMAADNIIPGGMYVLHHCDNPRCVNIVHLFVGTQQDNMDDCQRKGRKIGPKGQQVNTCKLSPKQVLRIRAIHHSNMGINRVKRGTASALAEEYGVHISTIHYVVGRRSWKHLPK